jgi:hypothetical protein
VGYPLENFLSTVAESIHSIVMEAYDRRCYFLYGDYMESGIDLDFTVPEAQFQVRRSPRDPKTRWIDSTPLNTHYVWALAQVFPRAKFIHNLRHPAEVARSLQNFDVAGAASAEVDDALSIWIQHTQNALLAEQALGPMRVLRVRYERIENEAEGLLQEIMSFVGESYSADCVLPLQTKVNSSLVGKKNADIPSAIYQRELFQQAVDIYTEAVNDGVKNGSSESASKRLETVFNNHWRTAFSR